MSNQINPILDKLKNALLNGAGNFIEKVGDAIDKNVTNKEEAMRAKTEAEKVANDFAVQMEEIALKKQESEDKAVTERWAADMTSDNKLSKNARPIGFLSLLGFFYLIAVLDALNIQFNVPEPYIDLLETLLVTVAIAYFGGRTLEKGSKIFTAKKK